MAFPKKKSRRIIVKNQPFRWMIRNEYNVVILLIISENKNEQKLFARFRHHITGEKSCMFNHPFIIKPDLVKNTILYGFSKGYEPEIKGEDLDLGDLSEALVLNFENE